MIVRSILITLIFLGFGLVLANENDKAEGFYLVDGKSVQLKYAYPVKYVSENKSILKSVICSATPISTTDLKSEDLYSTFSKKARAGEIQALQVIFKPDKTVKQIHIYDKDLGGAFQTNFGNFEATRFDSTGVTGKITMDTPKDFIKQTFQYKVSFSVNWAD